MKQKTNKKFSVRKTKTGLGLVTNVPFKKDDFVIEYKGPKVSNEIGDGLNNLYLFDVGDDKCINGAVKSNLARYLNHSCRPNCEPELDEDQNRVFIYAKKKIEAGTELTYDYGRVYFKEYIEPKGCRCEKCEPA